MTGYFNPDVIKFSLQFIPSMF